MVMKYAKVLIQCLIRHWFWNFFGYDEKEDFLNRKKLQIWAKINQSIEEAKL
jgi:hypothetical protein